MIAGFNLDAEYIVISNIYFSTSFKMCLLIAVCVQEVNEACRMFMRLEPLLGIYSDLVRYYLAVSLGVHRSTGKLLSVLASIFTELAQKVQTL